MISCRIHREYTFPEARQRATENKEEQMQLTTKDVLEIDTREINSVERLGHAIKDGDVPVIVDYIRNGGDIERRTKNDWTPLHLASLYGIR